MKRLFLTGLVSLVLAVQPALAVSDLYKTLIGTGFKTRANYTADGNGAAFCFTDGRPSNFIFNLDADFVSGTSTLDVKVQHSSDSSASAHWKDLATFTQVTTSDSVQNIHNVDLTTHVQKCLRAVIDVGAAGTPNYNVLVRVMYRNAQ